MMGIEFRDILLALALLGQVGNFAWLYFERRNDKANERINELAIRISKGEKDVSGLIAASEGAPNHHDLADVYRELRATNKKVDQLVGESKSQIDLLRMIANKIIEKGME